MSGVAKSLLFDSILATVAVFVILTTGGTSQTVAGGVLFVTLVKAPYDVWAEWRRSE